MECACGLVPRLVARGATPLVLDLGAGKALLTRAVYEALGRKVAAVALDCRDGGSGRDLFYDPEPCAGSAGAFLTPGAPSAAEVGGHHYGRGLGPQDASYLRVVADVGNSRQLNARMKEPLTQTSKGGIVALSKHLCGGFTDCSLVRLRMALCTALALCFSARCH
jgi:hypothetical protein